MRSIIALLVAAIALVGAASAWESQEVLQYQYQKSVAMQAGQNLTWLEGTISGAGSMSNTAYGTASTLVGNQLGQVNAPLEPIITGGLVPDTHNTLTQGGNSQVYTAAPDLENPDGIQFSGQATSFQNLALSGNYGGCDACGDANPISADFSQISGVAVGDYSTTGYGTATGEINPQGNYVVEANMGSSTTVGLEQTNAIFAVPTMSGNTQAWAGFSGAYNGDGAVDFTVNTHAEADGEFNMDFP